MNKTLAQSNNGSLPVLHIVPGNDIKLKNPGASKSCAQARSKPKVVSGISHRAFQTRLPECNIAQIYTPKSRAILIYMIIIVCFGFTCQLSSHLLDFFC